LNWRLCSKFLWLFGFSKFDLNPLWSSLDHNRITDIGVQHLAAALKHNNKLQTLLLSNNERVSDPGIKALADGLKGNKGLRQLELQFTNSSNVGTLALADMLRKNSTLTSLVLNHTPTADVGAAALAYSLRTNTTLLTLSLSHTPITDAGAAAITDMLAFNSSLQQIDLSNTKITDEGQAVLAAAMQRHQLGGQTPLKINRSNQELVQLNESKRANKERHDPQPAPPAPPAPQSHLPRPPHSINANTTANNEGFRDNISDAPCWCCFLRGFLPLRSSSDGSSGVDDSHMNLVVNYGSTSRWRMRRRKLLHMVVSWSRCFLVRFLGVL